MLKNNLKFFVLSLIFNIFLTSKNQGYNDLENFEYPVDIVYLWVDGNDPEWLAQKYYWQNRNDAFADHRFADHDELRYSLRSVFMFAPYFNHIYIVTMNQRPKWLVDHPKVTIIDHKEIFKNLNDLPTFNSQAIESNLHRIPNLSDHFIYFNDDVFLGTPSKISDFFISDIKGDNKIKVLFEKGLSPSGPPIENETTYRRAWRNTNAFLDKLFFPERRYRLSHAPFALRRSFIEDAEKAFPFIFESNSSHKFRCDADYNMTNGLLQYYWYYNNKIETGNTTNMMVSLRDDDVIENTKINLENLKKLNINSFCLQDVMGNNSDQTKKLLSEFLQELYSNPAPWEVKGESK